MPGRRLTPDSGTNHQTPPSVHNRNWRPYLEEALKSSEKLEQVRRRGDLLAFADDMLVMSNNVAELTEIIEALAQLNTKWNLRLNKKKSEILTRVKLEEVSGVKCTKMVKYLGIRVVTDKNE